MSKIPVDKKSKSGHTEHVKNEKHMTHVNTEAEVPETLRTNITVPVELWNRARVQAARKTQNLQEFAASAIEFFVSHLEEEWKSEVRAEPRKKAS